MKNDEILKIAMQQSAYDIGCVQEDFLKDEAVIVSFQLGKHAKKYYREPIGCNFISYGSNIVAATRKEYQDIVNEYIHKFEFCHCFETPNIHWQPKRKRVYLKPDGLFFRFFNQESIEI